VAQKAARARNNDALIFATRERTNIAIEKRRDFRKACDAISPHRVVPINAKTEQPAHVSAEVRAKSSTP
jgi:hypothetical protein